MSQNIIRPPRSVSHAARPFGLLAPCRPYKGFQVDQRGFYIRMFLG
jgi:hypothetical protein